MPMGVVFIKKCDVKGGGGGGGQKVNVIVTLRSAKVVWKCPLTCCIDRVTLVRLEQSLQAINDTNNAMLFSSYPVIFYYLLCSSYPYYEVHLQL